jgi:hypothetical protein
METSPTSMLQISCRLRWRAVSHQGVPLGSRRASARAVTTCERGGHTGHRHRAQLRQSKSPHQAPEGGRCTTSSSPRVVSGRRGEIYAGGAREKTRHRALLSSLNSPGSTISGSVGFVRSRRAQDHVSSWVVSTTAKSARAPRWLHQSRACPRRPPMPAAKWDHHAARVSDEIMGRQPVGPASQ